MKTYKYFFCALLMSICIGCAIQKGVVQGSVLMRTETEAHINLGSGDGLFAGDTLTIYRNENPFGSYTRPVRVGLAKVVKIIDTHHAVVELLQGSLYERDVVEKKQK